MFLENRAAVAARSGLDEYETMERVAEGDGAAFDLLYRAYFRRLTRFLDQITRRPHLTEEILDDTMTAVWRQANRFDARSSVSTWIFSIAYNQAMKALRRERRLGQVPCDPGGPPSMPSPEFDLIESQRRSGLQRFLATLSTPQRAVVELTYYHGHSYEEIARIIGCPVNTVKTRMFHARRKLKILLLENREDWQ